MSDVDALTCPKCDTTIEPSWDWCENCGYDPDGLKPPEGVEAPPPGQRLVAPEAPPPQKRGFVDEHDPTDANHNSKLLIGGIALIVVIGIAGFVIFGKSEGVDTSTGGTVPAVKASFIGTPSSSQIATEKTENWWQVTPPDKSFTVEVPGVADGPPKYKSDRTSLGGRQVDTAAYSGEVTVPDSAGSKPAAFRFAVSEATGDDATVAKQAIEQLQGAPAGGSPGSATSAQSAAPEDLEYQGHKAKQLSFTDKSGDQVTARVVTNKGRVYTMSATGSQPVDPEQYKRFVESLKLST